jgi:putative redox protein
MAERIIVRQDKQFRTVFLAADPEDPAALNYETVEDIHQLTPYGMLLASLGSCTALVLHTYAQNHEIPLIEVELNLAYLRVFREDCEDCEENEDSNEEITEQLKLEGNLSAAAREKLLRIAHFCPIYQILGHGVKVKTFLMQTDLGENDLIGFDHAE